MRRVPTRDKRGEGVRLLCEWNAKINTPGDGGMTRDSKMSIRKTFYEARSLSRFFRNACVYFIIAQAFTRIFQ